jgi:hypothetical protein
MRPLATHASPIGNAIQRTTMVSSTDMQGLLASRNANVAIRETSRATGPIRPTGAAQPVGRATIDAVLAGR